MQVSNAASNNVPANAAPRFTLSLPMRYRIEGQAEWKSTKTVNVSASGLLFVATDKLKKGTRIELEISMSAANLKPTRLTAVSEVLRQGREDEPLVTTVRHIRSKTLDGDISA